MPLLTQSPELPVPGRQVQLTFTLAESGANFVRVWVTVAPTGSSFEKQLTDTKDPRNRVRVYEGSGGSDFPLTLTFDKGGKYTFVAQEYIRGSGYGGGYQGDPAGSDKEEKVGSETAIPLYIGQRLTQQVGPSGDQVTLVLWVWNATVQSTTKSRHGEDSPALTSVSPTSRARSAMESASVTSLVSALAGQAVTTVLGSAAAMASNYVTKWNAHIADSTVHQDADASNMLPVGLGSAATPKDFKELVSAAILRMRRHFTNDDAGTVSTTGGIDSGDFHNVGSKQNDWTNMPLYQSVGVTEALGGFADLHRCYEAHRISTSVHDTADTANELNALPALLAVHSAYLSVLASSSPTPPPAQSTGAQLLISQGFKEG